MTNRFVYFILGLLLTTNAFGVDFPVVTVKAPRQGDSIRTYWQEADKPYQLDGNTDLVLINPDGSEQILFDCSDTQAVIDPNVSFNGEVVYFSLVEGIQNHTGSFSNILKVNVLTSELKPLTSVTDSFNSGPCILPSGKLVFTSTRNKLQSIKGGFKPEEFVPQLFIMEEDGSNVEQIGYLNLSGALHPIIMPDGRIMWSTHEDQGYRSNEHWSLWASNPDGTNWGPLFSSFFRTGTTNPFHFQTVVGNKVVVSNYYKGSNFGAGILLQFDPSLGFQDWNPDNVVPYIDPNDSGTHPFQPVGTINLTPKSTSKDISMSKLGVEWNNTYPGKWTHPSACPGGLLACWTGPSPTGIKGRGDSEPMPLGTIAFLPQNSIVNSLSDFEIVKQDINYNYQQPVALVPYIDIHGIEKPVDLPYLPDTSLEYLPKGSPYGIIGTDSFYTRESAPFTSSSNWKGQGSDAGTYSNTDIEYVRILVQEPGEVGLSRTSAQKSAEGLKILKDIPLRKFDNLGNPILDSNGDPDTSFWAKLQADQSFTFQMLDKDHRVLTMAQTWHQVRPGETRIDCHGCHAHFQPSSVDFFSTVAGNSDPWDLTSEVPVAYGYTRDVKPIIEQHCNSCHSGITPAGDINLEQELSVVRVKSQNALTIAFPFQSRISPMVQRIMATDSTKMPPPETGDSLTQEEIQTIINWLDTGAMEGDVEKDGTKPCIHIEEPTSKPTALVNKILFGSSDLYGLSNVSVTADFDVNGNSAGSELINLFSVVDSIYSLDLSSPVNSGQITISAVDNNSNTQTVVRNFVSSSTDPPEECDCSELQDKLDRIRAILDE